MYMSLMSSYTSLAGKPVKKSFYQKKVKNIFIHFILECSW